MEKLKLKPCPFCGNQIPVMLRDKNTGAAKGMYCNRCGVIAKYRKIRIESSSSYEAHEERLRNAWNRRQ